LTEQFAPSNQLFIQTMNQVFELAGDLVPPKVAHDLMRLLAEGAGEDDEDADSLLQSSAVICWVLGEYGTAYSTHSADDIIGRLCDDVAESHAGDITVKGYAVTAITKICAFEISADRQVHLIPECQTFIEDLLAAHSTDLQQRAYKFQVILGLNPETVASILPMDANCEDIEVDRNLSFLNEFIESAAANGARLYIPESERSDMRTTVITGIHDQLEPSAHALRFEAYEVAKLPSPPIAAAASSFPSFEEQKKPESPRSLRTHLAANSGFDTVSFNPDITRLWLDGVQKKWGQPSSHPPQLSSSSPSGLDKKRRQLEQWGHC
jgi:AP-4 complex subunit epsilon-1